jgi:hypothetical protein
MAGRSMTCAAGIGATSALARELAAFDGWVVGVMEDPAFAGQEEPAGLRCAHFEAAWLLPTVMRSGTLTPAGGCGPWPEDASCKRTR